MFNAPIHVKPEGGGGVEEGHCIKIWMFSVGPGVKHLTNVPLGGGIFEPSFFYRRGMWSTTLGGYPCIF